MPKEVMSKEQCQSFNTTEVDFTAIVQSSYSTNKQANDNKTRGKSSKYVGLYYLKYVLLRKKSYKACNETGKHNPQMGEKTKSKNCLRVHQNVRFKKGIKGGHLENEE